MTVTARGLAYTLTRFLVALAIPVAVFADNSQPPTVQTQSGAVQGVVESVVERFLGIPYALPPVGDLRWQPPREPEPWRGTRLATQFGSACAQHGNFYTSNDPSTFERPYGSEDCLYLNVWKPRSADKRPVLVFIHGGSAVHGAASLPLYDGQRLAKELDAVFVSINYRLGFLGHVHLAPLQNGDPVTDSGSFALLDQIRALDWVTNNIAQFGGDGGNVTVMGHSAGCGSIWSLMRSPLASGKFHKAICLSGISLDNTRAEQREASHRLLSKLLLNDGEIASSDELEGYLKGHSRDELRDYLYSKTTEEITGAGQRIPMAASAVDGHVVTTAADEAVVNPVPTLMGQTRNEAPILMLHAMANQRYLGLWDLIHCDCLFRQRDLFDSFYGFAKFKFTGWFVNSMLLDRVDDGADLLVEKNSIPVYRYRFEWDKLPEPWLSMVGVYHGIDIPFIFGNFGVGTHNFTHFSWRNSSVEEREAIHARMTAAFRGFIESADPNRYSSEASWPEWGASRAMRVIDAD